eukprot:13861616-Alexandrium_andersonii.AAC.1
MVLQSIFPTRGCPNCGQGLGYTRLRPVRHDGWHGAGMRLMSGGTLAHAKSARPRVGLSLIHI